jgi:hypothetical protein
LKARKKPDVPVGRVFQELVKLASKRKMWRVDTTGYESQTVVFKYKAVFLNQTPIQLHI